MAIVGPTPSSATAMIVGPMPSSATRLRRRGRRLYKKQTSALQEASDGSTRNKRRFHEDQPPHTCLPYGDLPGAEPECLG